MRGAVFLDRDGTLIRNHHYGCDPDAIELLDGVIQGLKLLKEAGFRLVVVTNQSGIARGFFTEAQLQEMHSRLAGLLERQGVRIDAIYYCPHHPEGTVPHYSIVCDCRKPRPGMVERACTDLHIDPTSCWLIGDILDDVEAGKSVGCRAVLLDVGTEGVPESPVRTPDYVARDFLDAVGYILRNLAAMDRTEGAGREEREERRDG